MPRNDVRDGIPDVRADLGGASRDRLEHTPRAASLRSATRCSQSSCAIITRVAGSSDCMRANPESWIGVWEVAVQVTERSQRQTVPIIQVSPCSLFSSNQVGLVLPAAFVYRGLVCGGLSSNEHCVPDPPTARREGIGRCCPLFASLWLIRMNYLDGATFDAAVTKLLKPLVYDAARRRGCAQVWVRKTPMCTWNIGVCFIVKT